MIKVENPSKGKVISFETVEELVEYESKQVKSDFGHVIALEQVKLVVDAVKGEKLKLAEALNILDSILINGVSDD